MSLIQFNSLTFLFRLFFGIASVLSLLSFPSYTTFIAGLNEFLFLF